MSALDELKSLDSAEAFFRYLDAPFDPAVLGVLRLHILRRMGEGLALHNLSNADDAEVRATAREILIGAYEDLAAKGPLGQRLFKVLKDHDPKRPARARGKSFVALGDVRAAR